MKRDKEFYVYKNLKTLHRCVFIFICLIIFACIRWQILDSGKLATFAQDRVITNPIKSIRGAIYSSDGATLAYSEPRYNMYLWMDDLIFFENKEIQTRLEFLNKVSPIIGIASTEIEKKIDDFYNKRGIRWIKLAEGLTYKQWSDLISLKTDKNPQVPLRGFSFLYSSKRIYPEGRLATHVVGLVNMDERNNPIGVSGLERYWSEILNPIQGFTFQELDARGSTVTSSLIATIEPRPGSSIYVNINKKLQQVVEEQLKVGVERYKAKSGTTIVMDPKTGKILAMANFPDYDPNSRIETDPNVYGNIALTSPYENGSTGKAITLAASVDLGLVNPDTVMPPHDGCIVVTHDLPPICTFDKKPKGEITVRECLASSDNVCFYRIGLMMKVPDFYRYLNAFGAGRPTGVDLHPGEDSFGYLPTPEKWNIADIAAFSYGQGYQMNSLQATVAYGAMANFGVRMKPYFVYKIVEGDGEERLFNPQPMQRVISESASEVLNSMMYYNYTVTIRPHEHWYSHLREYAVGVKTGTGQIVKGGRYGDSVNATLIGYDLSPQRTFVMLIRLEDPQGSSIERLASNNVRIVWLDTFNAIKDILGVPKK